ncbi:MAG: hypothetical protein H7X99_00010 [Saprospiraceae bacterium]|nr:hypothetical protein [Saprospiraceae bacterium]
MIKNFIICFVLVNLFSCKQSNIPDTSHIESDVKIIRTDQELINVKNREDLDKLILKNPAFYGIYFKEVLPVYQGENKDSLYRNFSEFIKDTSVISLFTKVYKSYHDFSSVKKEIDMMYKYLKYYFPEHKDVPDIYTYVSEFAFQIFIFEDENGKDGIGIGLDMFMSPEIDYKTINPDNTNFSDYLTRSWDSRHIVKKLTDLYVNEMIGNAPGHRLIDQMIHNGKALYITDLLLPEVHDSIILEYTGDQLDWCTENALEMWSFFLGRKLFYESNPVVTGKYLNPSPNSPDMPSGAPGRTANFIGWQIVRAYMDRYPDTGLKELISLTDSQMIMEKSKYKPKQK